MRKSVAVFLVAASLMAIATLAIAQKKAEMSDAQYTAQSLTGAALGDHHAA